MIIRGYRFCLFISYKNYAIDDFCLKIILEDKHVISLHNTKH